MTIASKVFSSWGGHRTNGANGVELVWRDSTWPVTKKRILAFGLGRSYGDSCLLDDGCLIETRRIDHLMAFDERTGILRCEAGCTLSQLMEFCVPRGWLFPVTPGTKFVTVGGCVANDVHGKNHQSAGTFGRWVTRFCLRRSDSGVLECSQTENTELFNATIGGLGLTGVLLWVEFKLRRIGSPLITQTVRTFDGLEALFGIARREGSKAEHSVAWLDTTHRGIPRGLFIMGDHAPAALYAPEAKAKSGGGSAKPLFSFPVTLPDFALGGPAIRVLNTGYYWTNAWRAGDRDVSCDRFFYPLDSVANWNRAYGRKGLAQYQFTVALPAALEVLRETLAKVQVARQASFLTVVKFFGERESPGLLSFPRPGVTICFDFPNYGDVTRRLFDDLDRTVFAAGGALYPAKDFRMSKDAFEKSFPRHLEFKTLIDPACSSNFARRTGLTV